MFGISAARDQFLILIGYQSGTLSRLSYFRRIQAVPEHPPPVPVYQTPARPHRKALWRLPYVQPCRRYPFTRLQITGKCLGILRADFQAAAAVNAVINHNPRLFVSDGNGLHRAVAHTFIAVTAFCVLKIYDFHSGISSFIPGKPDRPV